MNKYIENIFTDAVMHDNPNYLAAVERGDILSPQENKHARFSSEPSPWRGSNIKYLVSTDFYSDSDDDPEEDYKIVPESEIKGKRYYYKIIRNPSKAQFNLLKKTGNNRRPRAVIYNSNIYFGSEMCIHENIIEFIELIEDVRLNSGSDNYNIFRNEFSCWQIRDGNELLLSESYTNDYNFLHYADQSEDTMPDNIKEKLVLIKKLILKSINTLPSNMKTAFKFKLEMIANGRNVNDRV